MLVVDSLHFAFTDTVVCVFGIGISFKQTWCQLETKANTNNERRTKDNLQTDNSTAPVRFNNKKFKSPCAPRCSIMAVS